MFRDGPDLPHIGNWPKSEGERIEMSASREEVPQRERVPQEGEPILKNWWRLSGMHTRVKGWWERLVRH